MTYGLLAIAFLLTLAIRAMRRVAPLSPMHASASGTVGAYGDNRDEYRDPSARASPGPSLFRRSPSSSPDARHVTFALARAAGIGATVGTAIVIAMTCAVGIAGMFGSAVEIVSAILILIVIEVGAETAVAVAIKTAVAIVRAIVTVVSVKAATAIAVAPEPRLVAGSYINVGGIAVGAAGGGWDRTLMTTGHQRRSGATFERAAAGPRPASAAIRGLRLAFRNRL